MGGSSCKNSNYHLHDSDVANAMPMLDDEDSGNFTETMECNGAGVHLRPVEFCSSCNECSGDKILKLFDIVSALKFAYLQFQKAHIPYEPKKIIVADELVVTQLEALCKIKRAHKQKHLNAEEFQTPQCDFLKENIKYNERLLEELRNKLKAKNFEALCLQQQLRHLDLRNKMLPEKIMKMKLGRKEASISPISAFEEAFHATYKSIHDFAKPLITLMKASCWDLDVAAKSIAEAIVYSKRSDKKYTFETYIARRMFNGMPYEPCNIEDVQRFDDPIDFLLRNPSSEFAKFCQSKYLLIVHPVMEASFFGNLDHRTLVQCGKHPKTPFYQIFAKLAKWVWILRGIATLIDPKAEPFVVRRETKFSDTFMESVKGGGEVLEGGYTYTVGLMVMPGFRVGKTLIKSRVYLLKKESASC